MAEYSLGLVELAPAQESDFGEFINIVSGRSIVSGADWGSERIEFGLSGDGMLRVFWTPKGLHANFVSTTNEDEIPPLMLQITEGNKRLTARALEFRLRALRNLYAIVHLALDQKLHLAGELVASDPDCDFEILLDDDELLYVECLAPGSWYVTLWSKLRTSYRAVLQTVALVSLRGREAILKKLEAEAKLKSLEAEEKEFDLFAKKVDYGLGLSKQLHSDAAREAFSKRIEKELGNFLLSDGQSAEVQNAKRRLLDDEKDEV